MSEFEDYYEILDVDPSATSGEIKKAYRDKCFILHPDRLEGAPETAKRRAEKELLKVNLAYDVLKDDVKRKEYDRQWGKLKAKPNPIVKPSRIRFSNMGRGEIKRTSFVIRNDGGPYNKIWVRNPDSWLKVVNYHSLTDSEELPLEVEIEATALDWDSIISEYINIKLDDIETQLVVELQSKPMPRKIICPHCGWKNLANLIYCEKCEVELYQKYFTCMNCSSSIPSNSMFCRVCGSKV